MLARLWTLSSVLWKEFRSPGLASLLFLAYPLYWAWVSLGLLLDACFFRSRQTNAKTLIVAGPPRSGTTFLQRFLVDNTHGRASLLWEGFVPSLSWQRLLAPLVRRAIVRQVPRLDLGAAHLAQLDLPETDDLAVFARHLDSFFYYVYGLSWHEDEFPEYISPALRPAEIASRDLRWLRRSARRNRINGDTELAILKSFSLGFALGEAQSQLESPRIVYVSRAPHEALASSLSMVRAVLGLRGLYSRTAPSARERHVQRVVRASLLLQTSAISQLQRLPPGTVLVIRYEDLVSDFASTMNRILRFGGVAISADIVAAVNERANRQRTRKSAHQYSLAEFGLDETAIREQFAEVYKYFAHI